MIIINSLKNLITDTELLTPLSVDKNNAMATPIEYNLHTLTIEVSSKKCTLNQSVLISGLIKIEEKENKFTFTGKITKIIPSQDQRSLVEITLIQTDKTLWHNFIKAKELKQLRLDKIIRSFSGDE